MVILEERRQPRCTPNKWRRPPIEHGRRGILEPMFSNNGRLMNVIPIGFGERPRLTARLMLPHSSPHNSEKKSARIVNVILPEGHSRPFFKSA